MKIVTFLLSTLPILPERTWARTGKITLDEKRYNHIGCIYLTLVQCVFSNVSKNCLPKKRHSHIGCICINFLHYAFSNVSSNDLPGRMQNHIGCICLTFLHGVFSDETLFRLCLLISHFAFVLSKEHLDCFVTLPPTD